MSRIIPDIIAPVPTALAFCIGTRVDRDGEHIGAFDARRGGDQHKPKIVAQRGERLIILVILRLLPTLCFRRNLCPGVNNNQTCVRMFAYPLLELLNATLTNSRPFSRDL